MSEPDEPNVRVESLLHGIYTRSALVALVFALRCYQEVTVTVLVLIGFDKAEAAEIVDSEEQVTRLAQGALAPCQRPGRSYDDETEGEVKMELVRERGESGR
jgi:hypothetical protein